MDLDWLHDDAAAWSDRLDRAGGAALQQSAGYAEAAHACGATVRKAVLSRDGRIVALAQVLDRRSLRLISRGPVWVGDTPEALRRRAVRRLARHPGLTVVTPEAALVGPGLMPLMTGRHHAVWDLSPDPDALRAGLDPRWRGSLAAALRRNPDIGCERAGALGHLVAAEAAQRHTRGYRALPAAFTRALPPAALRVWDWRDRGAIGAAMCFVRHGARATYHIAWAGPAARAAAVHQAMLWHAALSLRAEGVRHLDLGDVNSDDAPGLARFKLGTGAPLHRLGATALVVPM